MAILEKEVFITLNSANINHFQSKGYAIPRVRNKKGKLSVPRGTEIKVEIEDLTNRSHVKVTKICDDCGIHVLNQTYYSLLITREDTDGKDRCKSCGKKRSRKLEVIPYEKSVEYYAIKNKKENLIKEFSKKNEVTLDKVIKGSNSKFLWECQDCQSEYTMMMNDRTSNKPKGCPYCAGRKVNHTNCLTSIRPDIAELLIDKEIGLKVTIGSAKKAKFACPYCNNEEIKTVSNVVTKGFSCSNCSHNLSFAEKFMGSVLKQLKINFKTQKSFYWSDNKRYDFFIPSNNLIIETHGIQHYKMSGYHIYGARKLDEEIENDNYKKEMANSNNIDNYVVIDCRYSTMEYMKNSILNSVLNEIYNLNSIDFQQAYEDTWKTNTIKQVCDLWNNGNDIEEISNIVKVSEYTIIKYLKRGNRLGWCCYDKYKIHEIRKNKLVAKLSLRVVQLNKDNVFIKEWDSAKDVYRQLGIPNSNISKVCNGNGGLKTAGGYKWMFKEDYDKLMIIK